MNVMCVQRYFPLSVLFCLAAAFGQSPDIDDNGPLEPAVRPAPSTPVAPEQPAPGINWNGIYAQSSLFLGLQHGFRLATERQTRNPRGNFWHQYGRSVGNLHGWADGDPFIVNYIGHPMQGAVASFIWTNNDGLYAGAEFGRNRRYWKSRLRATAFSTAYSFQFELGPASEATIGYVQSRHPQYGFVDLVSTPILGLAWTVAEDAIDKYVIRRFEDRVTNRYARILMRGWLNPGRSFANMVAFKAPWVRDTRPGTQAYRAGDSYSPGTLAPEPTESGLAPFEVHFYPVARTGLGGVSGGTCGGGGGGTALRVAETWQLALEVSGCNLMNLERDFSGDMLSFAAGPRWTPAPDRRVSPWLQLLFGGLKVTQEQMYPERKKLLEAAYAPAMLSHEHHDEYTRQEESTGFAIAAGGGLNVRLNGALELRIASLEYTRAWMKPVNGLDYSQGLQFSSGLVLKMGTW